MKYPKILIALLSILSIDSVYTESNPSKNNVGSSGVIVDSDLVTIRNDIENSTVSTSKEIITTELTVETTIVPDENEIQKNSTLKHENDIPVSTKKPRKKLITGINDDPNYVKGYFGGYYFVGTGKTKNYYFHGKYQKPVFNYYGSYNHKLEDKSSLGYYLGFAINKMDHNEYFRHNNYTHFNVHHYFFKNSTMLSEQYVGSDHLLRCAQNTSLFCPENTEAICLQNTTVWCASRISFVKPCETDAKECVITRIPCVKTDNPNCNQMVESVQMPCIAKITILDSYEDKNGLTLISVAGTFVLAPVSPPSERTYCVTIVAEPKKD